MDRMKDTIARLADQRAREGRRPRAAAQPEPTSPDTVLPGASSAAISRGGNASTEARHADPQPTSSLQKRPIGRQTTTPRAPGRPTVGRATPTPPMHAPVTGERQSSRSPASPDGNRADDTSAEDRILELPTRSSARSRASGAAKQDANTISPLRQPRVDATFTREGGSLPPASIGGMTSLGGAMREYLPVLTRKRQSRAAGTAEKPAPLTVPKSGELAKDVCPLCHGAGYFRVDVPVGNPSFGQPIPCECKERQIEERRRSELRQLSNLEAFPHSTFDTFKVLPSTQEAYDVSLRYAKDPRGWLVLSGGPGVGKTHLAAAIGNYQLAQGVPVCLSIVVDLLQHLRKTYAPSSDVLYDDVFDRIREAGLLILDDLGAENSTPWAMEKLFQIINYRYNYRMPTVITTNHRRLSSMDERIRSRLSDIGLVRAVTINAQDYRQYNAGSRARMAEDGNAAISPTQDTNPDPEWPGIIALYEQNIGPVRPALMRDLQQAEEHYPSEWIDEAFRQAAQRNKLSWSYVHAILKHWDAEGKM